MASQGTTETFGTPGRGNLAEGVGPGNITPRILTARAASALEYATAELSQSFTSWLRHRYQQATEQ
jgi:hypothetical protein